MAITTQNARLFLERSGLRPTYRRPSPLVIPGDLPINDYPVDRPQIPVRDLPDGFPPPDRSSTMNDPWPFGAT